MSVIILWAAIIKEDNCLKKKVCGFMFQISLPETKDGNSEATTTLKCSRLFSLEPIGIGTPLTESLTSYMSRLAEAHCVSTGVLLGRVILPIINKYILNRFGNPEANITKPFNINGLGVVTRNLREGGWTFCEFGFIRADDYFL